MSKQYLSLGIDVSGLPCVVVGGGKVGARRAILLQQAGAIVTVIAPRIDDSLRQPVSDGAIFWREGAYRSGVLTGLFLIVAATDDPALNRRIGQEALTSRVLCCVASEAECGRVVFPAMVEHDHMSVAIHSHGQDCRRSVEVRDRIASFLNAPAPA